MQRVMARIGAAAALVGAVELLVSTLLHRLASLVSMTWALIVAVFGIALWQSSRYPRWLAGLGLAGAAGTLAAGLAQATTAFSPTAMLLSMIASLALLAWAVAVSAALWRQAAR